MSEDPLIWWVAGMMILGAAGFVLRTHWSAEARDRRRRRRNYGKVVSRAKRPIVMLSVKSR